MRDVYDVIVAPVVTEKATREQQLHNVYTFVVHKNANKAQVAEAVETAWDVVVEDVRTARYAGKWRRAFLGRFTQRSPAGKQPEYKKAMVRLAADDHIEFYEVG